MNKNDFVTVGHINVDAGCVWIGDPCYILHNEAGLSPDLGKDWGDFSDRFLERLGYNESSANYDNYRYNAIIASHGFDPDESMHFLIRNGLTEYILDAATKEKFDIDKEKVFLYMKDNPYRETAYKGFAEFGSGTGIVTDTYDGDGTYPVSIRYGKNGRPSQVLIDFGDDE